METSGGLLDQRGSIDIRITLWALVVTHPNDLTQRLAKTHPRTCPPSTRFEDISQKVERLSSESQGDHGWRSKLEEHEVGLSQWNRCRPKDVSVVS